MRTTTVESTQLKESVFLFCFQYLGQSIYPLRERQRHPQQDDFTDRPICMYVYEYAKDIKWES